VEETEMDGKQFDKITRAFAAGTSRRSLLKLLGGGSLAVAVAPAIFRAEEAAAQGGGPGDACAPQTMPCAEGLLCAAEQEGVCYCEDPAEPWRGCACTTGADNPCGDTTLLCCADSEGIGVPGVCTSASVGCEPRGECSEPGTSCEAPGCCTVGECGANGWCTACYSGTDNPCGGLNEAFSADYICCTASGAAEGAVGYCVEADLCVSDTPNAGTGTTAETSSWIAPAAAVGAAAAAMAYKNRESKADSEA